MGNDTNGDSQSANISAHRVRLHVIIRFRAQGKCLDIPRFPLTHLNIVLQVAKVPRLCIWLSKMTSISSITLPMKHKPTSQLSPLPTPAKSAFSYPRNCEPTREKLATKKDKNSLSSPPPKVIFPPSLAPCLPRL